MQILKPLEEATRELSVEQTVSSSKVISLLNAILHGLQKHVVDDDKHKSQRARTAVLLCQKTASKWFRG